MPGPMAAQISEGVLPNASAMARTASPAMPVPFQPECTRANAPMPVRPGRSEGSRRRYGKNGIGTIGDHPIGIEAGKALSLFVFHDEYGP